MAENAREFYFKIAKPDHKEKEFHSSCPLRLLCISLPRRSSGYRFHNPSLEESNTIRLNFDFYFLNTISFTFHLSFGNIFSFPVSVSLADRATL